LSDSGQYVYRPIFKSTPIVVDVVEREIISFGGGWPVVVVTQ